MVKKLFFVCVFMLMSIIVFLSSLLIVIRTRPITEKCTGYLVINRRHIITCNGDTVLYDWHQKSKETQLKLNK